MIKKLISALKPQSFIRVIVREANEGKLEITRDPLDDFVWIKNCIDSSVHLYHLDICEAMVSNYQKWHLGFDSYAHELVMRIDERSQQISHKLRKGKANVK